MGIGGDIHTEGGVSGTGIAIDHGASVTIVQQPAGPPIRFELPEPVPHLDE